MPGAKIWLNERNDNAAIATAGTAASLLAALASSGIAQSYGVPHDDAFAMHALRIAQA